MSMMRVKKKMVVFLLVLFAMAACLMGISRFPVKAFADTAETESVVYDNTLWKNASDQSLTPEDDAAVSLNTWMNYYGGNLADKDCYEETGRLRVKITMSIQSFGENDEINSTMGHMCFTNTEIKGASDISGKYIKDGTKLIDFVVMPTGEGNFSMRIADFQWKTATKKIVLEEGEQFVIQADVTENGFSFSFNGEALGGYMEKAAGQPWTIADFVTAESFIDEDKNGK